MPKKVASRKHLTRQEKRDLDIEIGFLEGIVHRDPGYVDALQLLGDDYTKRGKYLSGLNIDQKLSGLRPRDPLVFYNLACSLCLTRNYQEAANALETAPRDRFQRPLQFPGMDKRSLPDTRAGPN